MAAEHGKQPQDDAGAGQNGKSNRNTTDADADGIVAVHIECLRRPEHENGEEVGTRDEGDDEGQSEDSGLLSQSLWEHGIFCVALPDHKSHDENSAQDQRCEHVRTRPRVLVPSPLHSHHEEKHAGNGKETAEVVDLGDNLLAALALAIGSGRWMVEDSCHYETDEGPDTAETANPSPTRV